MSSHVLAFVRLSRPLWLAPVVLLACSGEGTPDDKLAGLVVARRVETRTVDVDRAAASGRALTDALAVPHHRLAAALGAHRFEGTSRVRIASGERELELLEDETRLDIDPDGHYRASLENSRDYGREIYYVDGALFLKPRYGRYHRRPPTSDAEPAAIADDIFATLGAYYEVAAAGIAVTDGGAIEYGGRAARKLELARADAPTHEENAAPAEEAPQRAWRRDVKVESAAGEIILDAETGAPLAGKLDAVVTVPRDGKRLRMEIAATHRVTEIGSAGIDVTAPPADEVVATPRRHHEVIERDQLLDGLAPPARAKRQNDGP